MSNKFINKIVEKLRTNFFPTSFDREYKRWILDGGDEKRYLYDLDVNSVVIDLGGYKGQWASDIYSKYKCKVMIFEPVKSYAENIKKRFSSNEDIKVYDLALGRDNRVEEIYLVDDRSSTSTSLSKALCKENIFFVNLIDFFLKHKIEKVDLLKINIEGGEYEVLPILLETGIVKNIRNIQIQFHNFVPNSEKMMISIKEALSKTHRLTYEYKFIWENWELK